MNNNTELETDSKNVSKETPEEKTEQVDSQERTDKEDQTSQKGGSTYTDREKQLYERAKKAEAKLKKQELDEKSSKENTSNKETSKDMSQVPTEEIAKTVHALKDYSPEEVDTIFKQAKNMNVSPLEALKDEDVELLIQAKRAKVEKESKTPEPTNRQSSEEKDFSEWTAKDVNDKPIEEVTKYYDWLKKQK